MPSALPPQPELDNNSNTPAPAALGGSKSRFILRYSARLKCCFPSAARPPLHLFAAAFSHASRISGFKPNAGAPSLLLFLPGPLSSAACRLPVALFDYMDLGSYNEAARNPPAMLSFSSPPTPTQITLRRNEHDFRSLSIAQVLRPLRLCLPASTVILHLSDTVSSASASTSPPATQSLHCWGRA